MYLACELDYLGFYGGRAIIAELTTTGAFRLPWQQYSSANIELRVHAKHLSAMYDEGLIKLLP